MNTNDKENLALTALISTNFKPTDITSKIDQDLISEFYTADKFLLDTDIELLRNFKIDFDVNTPISLEREKLKNQTVNNELSLAMNRLVDEEKIDSNLNEEIIKQRAEILNKLKMLKNNDSASHS